MDRREFLKRCVSLGAGGVVLSNPALELRLHNRRPNVLFVLADQWRYCSTSHSDHKDALVQTPNLDNLAARGVHFSRCYSAHPLCTPNRASLITGRMPHEMGMISNDLMLPPSERCIAEVFGEAGYVTHYIGKWHIDGADKPGFVPRNWRRRGFRTFIGFNRGHFYYDSPTFTDDGVPMATTGQYTPGDYEPTFQTDLAIDFMEKNADRPFFCLVSWGPPHTPYTPPDGFDIYDPAKVVFRPNVTNGNAGSLAKYFGLCTSLDHEFGRLMATLERLGIDDNTLVVFNSDHGDGHGSHGIAHKNRAEEESCHIPLLMRLPGRLKQGGRAECPISTIDLMPTILSICSLPVPASCTGVDKSAAAMPGGKTVDASIYAEKSGDWRTVVKGPYKLIVESIDGVQTPTKLFDLTNDPYEMTNLLDSPDHAETLTEMLAELERWKQRTDDPFPDTPTAAQKMY